MKKTLFTKQKSFVSLAAALFSAALLVGCSDIFQERVPMNFTGNGATLAKFFDATKVLEKLEPPSQVFVSNGEYSDKIIVTWEKVTGARSYSVERAVATEKNPDGSWKVPDEGEFTSLQHSTFIVGTSFTDTIIDGTPANKLDYTNEAYQCGYFYRVCAKNEIDKIEESDWYPNYYKEAPEGQPAPQPDPEALGILLAPPTNVKATCGKFKDHINITWQKTKGTITNYKIYSSPNEDGSSSSQAGSVYGNQSDCSIEVPAPRQGVEYYFTVVAVGASGNESVASPVALGYALKAGAPAQVTGVVVDKGRGETTASEGITIKWAGEDSAGGEDAIKYRIYRYSSTDSSQRKLKDEIETTEFTDTSGLRPNAFYYYLVQAYSVNSSGEELKGAMSESGDDSEAPAEGYIVSPPQNVAVKKINGDKSHNIITFSAAIGSEYCEFNSQATINKHDWKEYTYVIYGCDTSSGTFAKLVEFKPTEPATDGMYEMQNVLAKNFYKVSVKNGTVESDQSAAIAPAPYPAKNLAVTRNGSISGYTNDDKNANANGVHAVKITWEAPDDEGLAGYNIYRSTKADKGFKKINESPVPSSETSYTYLDEQAKAGTYYYYRVLSLNSLGQGANYSNTEYGYGALTTYQYLREYIKTTLNSQKKLTLMHKSGNTAKLGQETAQGAISGSLSYDAHVSGVSGRVIMQYTNYADYYIMNDKSLGVYFLLNGNTNTSAGMDTNGTMDGTVTVTGMYPGSVVYDGIKIKGGAAGGGTYGVTRSGIDSSPVQANWTWGEK